MEMEMEMEGNREKKKFEMESWIENKRQKKQKRVVLFVGTRYRLMGIDMEELESISESYHRGCGLFPTPNNFVCNLVYHDHDLPINMTPIPANDTAIYLVGGEHLPRRHIGFSYLDVKPLQPPGTDPRRLSSKVYKLNPFSPPEQQIPEPIGVMHAGKNKPIIETLAGKIFAVGRKSQLPFSRTIPYPSPIIEMLDGLHSSSSSSSSSMVTNPESNYISRAVKDDALQKLPDQVFSHVLSHFVIGDRIFLHLFRNEGTPMVCFDASKGTDGEWVTDGLDLFASMRSFASIYLFPAVVRSVSVASEVVNDLGVVDIGENDDAGYVLLFAATDTDKNCFRYFAGIVNHSGMLLCYQEITADIFIDNKRPTSLRCSGCHFVDLGGGRVYVVVRGVGSDPPPNKYQIWDYKTVLCVSHFIISVSSSVGQIVRELSEESKPKKMKFVNVSSVKTYICSPNDDTDIIHQLNGAFFLQEIAV